MTEFSGSIPNTFGIAPGQFSTDQKRAPQMAIKMTDEQIERESVEQVFCLTGGELSDAPWAGHSYWFEGVPEWATDDFDRDTRHSASGEFRTIVSCFLYGSPDTEIVDEEGQIWDFVKSFLSSGETSCPFEDGSGIKVTREHCRLVRSFHRLRKTSGYSPKDLTARRAECPYCEARIGKKHGYVYLGDGWGEAVYRARFVFGASDVGCIADGTFGQDHVRSVLADYVRRFDRDLAAELRKPMSDDASEEDDAIELMNEHTMPGFRWDFREGDLLLLPEIEWAED